MLLTVITLPINYYTQRGWYISKFQNPTVLTKEKDLPVTTEYEAGRTHTFVRAGNPTTVPQSLQPLTK